MKKLTRAQQEVVELLKRNPDYFIVRTDYYHLQQIQSHTPIDKDSDGHKWITHIGGYFYKPTFNALLRLNIIKPTDQKDIYVLSEKE